jgi:hypothetical protein
MGRMGRVFYRYKRIKAPFFFLFLHFHSCLPTFQCLQTLASLSRAPPPPPLLIHHRPSTTARPSVIHPFLGERCHFMGKGKNLVVSSNKKIIEVDEDQVLEVIENRECQSLTTDSLPRRYPG